MESKQKTPTSVDQTVAQFIDAGIGLVMLPFSIAQQTFESTKENTTIKFDELKARGQEVESELFGKLDPLGQRFNLGAICEQVSLMLSPRASREAQLEALSGKVDTLVELVATLAAKKAAEQKAAAPKAPAKATTTDAAAKTPAAKATPKAATKATTTRKRASTTKTTATRATKPKAAPKTAPKTEPKS